MLKKGKRANRPRNYAHAWKSFWAQILKLFVDPVFIILTIVGNTFVFINCLIFYYIERGVNPNVDSLLDAYWWAITTVTTVGYGDITPITTQGRIHGILLMLAGTSIFLSYTALFAKALIEQDFDEVEYEVKKVEKKLEALKKNK